MTTETTQTITIEEELAAWKETARLMAENIAYENNKEYEIVCTVKPSVNLRGEPNHLLTITLDLSDEGLEGTIDIEFLFFEQYISDSLVTSSHCIELDYEAVKTVYEIIDQVGDALMGDLEYSNGRFVTRIQQHPDSI